MWHIIRIILFSLACICSTSFFCFDKTHKRLLRKTHLKYKKLSAFNKLLISPIETEKSKCHDEKIIFLFKFLHNWLISSSLLRDNVVTDKD